MDKQKEIEKMRGLIAKEPCWFDCINTCFQDTTSGKCLRIEVCEFLGNHGYGDIKAAAKEAVTGFQANLTKWLAKQYRESSTIEITAVFDKIEELLEETK